jgi:2-oxoglutarate dehydrogenase E1 component
MTQPLMTDLIQAKRSVRKLYTEALVGRGDITQEEYDQAKADFQGRLEVAFAETHAAETGATPIAPELLPVDDQIGSPDVTGVPLEVIHLIGDAHANKPDGFTVHSKLQQQLDKRVTMSREGGIDWGFGELLAFGSLLVEGTPVRLAGQDSRRGTFVQRHAVLHDRSNGQEWLPLANLSAGQGRFFVYDSLLSEYAALGFEYGYSVENTEALVLWEAQFGDFVNGAQSVIDEYVSAAEQKWGQQSGVVLLLPHGYEGQGPDHSSGRMERFLQLCAQENMIVSRPSTPASYFHLLRRQAYARPRRPLIVFTPKSMLRLRGASSAVADFTQGRFEPVIDDARIQDPSTVKRVLLHSGKIHYDLLNEVDKRGDSGAFALVRLEQFYPLPTEQLQGVLARYPEAEVMWVQEEPENQGAWPFLALELAPQLDRELRVSSRAASASPATGSSKRSAAEQTALIANALEF